MKAEITKIDILKKGVAGNYMRVYFKLDNGGFAKTDLVTTFRNFPRWKPLLEIGNIITDFKFRNGGKITTIDADSYPKIYKQHEPQQEA